MRWIVDECCDAGLVETLRAAGHDVRYVKETDRGAADESVIALAASEDRVLLTEDKDFGELAFRFGSAVPGIVLIRMDQRQRDQKRARVLALIEAFGQRLVGSHAVVHANRFRLRPLVGGS